LWRANLDPIAVADTAGRRRLWMDLHDRMRYAAPKARDRAMLTVAEVRRFGAGQDEGDNRARSGRDMGLKAGST